MAISVEIGAMFLQVEAPGKMKCFDSYEETIRMNLSRRMGIKDINSLQKFTKVRQLCPAKSGKKQGTGIPTICQTDNTKFLQ